MALAVFASGSQAVGSDPAGCAGDHLFYWGPKAARCLRSLLPYLVHFGGDNHSNCLADLVERPFGTVVYTHRIWTDTGRFSMVTKIVGLDSTLQLGMVVRPLLFSTGAAILFYVVLLWLAPEE
jgi:hypothetical protein